MRARTPDGIDLAVHDLGPGRDGRVALCAHATGFHGRVWAPLAARLSGLHPWALDFRAHGESPVPEGAPLDWECFGTDVLAAVDALAAAGLPATGLVGIGHSMGGAALLLAESARPGTFGVLWLFEPVVFPPRSSRDGRADGDGDVVDPGSLLASGARARRAVFESLDAAEANFAAKAPMSAFDAAARRAYVEGGFAPDPEGVRLRCRPEDEARIYEQGGRHPAWDRLPEIAVPTTVVRGALGLPGPGAVAGAVASRLPHGRLEVHDEVGHFAPMTHPVAMAESVDRAAARVG